MAKKQPQTIDEYIADFPGKIQTILQEIRKAIHEVAPEAKEGVSYNMPAFKQNEVLVWFAAFKNHIGFFPKSTAIEAFKERLTPYKTSKGTIQFPLDQPIPLLLIKEMVRYRIKEVRNKK
jgi:uncharacterized protein YdhG (YjbR/CyaY superfamily)